MSVFSINISIIENHLQIFSRVYYNSFMTEVPIIKKPVHCFAFHERVKGR